MKKISSIIFLTLFGVITFAQTVVIGNQVWMSKNLDVSNFRNGDAIPEAKTAEEWKKAGKKKQPAWCYYNNDPENGKTFGKLYNWYAVTDPRGIAPEGYRVPSFEEWGDLTSYLGGNYVAGIQMKSKSGWLNGGNGKDSLGLSFLPGGNRFEDGTFDGVGGYCALWSSSGNRSDAMGRGLSYLRDDATMNFISKKAGISVRCIKD
jgi:uncharacterized protein (TIGR02145 family)